MAMTAVFKRGIIPYRIIDPYPTYYCRAASVSKRSEANNCGLFEILRYLYLSVCTGIAQDRAHLMQVLYITSAHCALSFGTLAAESPFR